MRASMQRVLVLGAGKVGSLIAGLLSESGDYEAIVADRDAGAADRVADGHWPRQVRGETLDATDEAAVAKFLTQRGCRAVFSCLPYHANPPVARAAREAGVHYFDLTEDLTSTRAVRAAADGAAHAFVPQCGLAPGFVAIVAADLVRRFEEADSVRLRVGALPVHPSNTLKYALTWSTDGLVNEYGNPCHALVNGREVELQPLEGVESMVIDGVEYESFNTSGGLGSLAETFAGRIRDMNYKTLRYPGHCALMRFLMRDLRLNEDRDTLKRILEAALPHTDDDMVIVHVSVIGRENGRLRELTFVRHVYPKKIADRRWTAIQVATASGACAVLDLVMSEPDTHRGFVRQEDIGLENVLNNRFGKCFRGDVR